MLNPLSWSLDAWFFSLQVLAFVILGVTVAVGYFLSTKQAKEILELKTDLATARGKQAEAETELKEVSERVFKQGQPRWAQITNLFETLKGKPHGTVEILYVANDEEVFLSASALGEVLSTVGWTVTRNEVISEADSMPGWRTSKAPLLFKVGGHPGISVVAGPAGKPFDTGSPVLVLVRALLTESVSAQSHPVDLPANPVRVIVGPKP